MNIIMNIKYLFTHLMQFSLFLNSSIKMVNIPRNVDNKKQAKVIILAKNSIKKIGGIKCWFVFQHLNNLSTAN